MAASVKEIEQALYGWAPASLAEEWDNVGLQVGDPEAMVEQVVVSLDTTYDTLAFALEQHANLIVCHHPLIFKPLSNLDLSRYVPGLIAALLRHNISVISMHTNLDSARGGVNDRLCKILGIVDTSPMVPRGEKESITGLGRIGRLGTPMDQREFLGHVCQALSRSQISYAGHVANKRISTVAVCSGSGSTLLDIALEMGAHAFVTGEIKHSTAIEAKAMGILLVDGGHFHTEQPVVLDLEDCLKDISSRKGWGLEVHPFKAESSPINVWPEEQTGVTA